MSKQSYVGTIEIETHSIARRTEQTKAVRCLHSLTTRYTRHFQLQKCCAQQYVSKSNSRKENVNHTTHLDNINNVSHQPKKGTMEIATNSPRRQQPVARQLEQTEAGRYLLSLTTRYTRHRHLSQNHRAKFVPNSNSRKESVNHATHHDNLKIASHQSKMGTVEIATTLRAHRACNSPLHDRQNRLRPVVTFIPSPPGTHDTAICLKITAQNAFQSRTRGKRASSHVTHHNDLKPASHQPQLGTAEIAITSPHGQQPITGQSEQIKVVR